MSDRSAPAELPDTRADEQALVRAFLATGRELGWEHAPEDLLRSLPTHAARAGLIDDLLAEDGYLLHADLREIRPLAGQAATPAGRQRAKLLRLSPREVLAAGPGGRAAMFSVTAALEGLPSRPTAHARAAASVPYRAAWAVAAPSAEHSVLLGHDSAVNALCAVTLSDPITGADTVYLASASSDATVRTWNPATGTEARVLTGHRDEVTAACAVTLGGTACLATASSDALRVWDPATGDCVRVFPGYTTWVKAICAFTRDGAPRLATAGDDRTVRIWDPATGTELRALTGHGSAVNAACAVTLGGTTCLATASDDATVRIWNPARATAALVIPNRDEALSVAYTDGLPFVGMTTGLLAIRLNRAALTGTQGRDGTGA